MQEMCKSFFLINIILGELQVICYARFIYKNMLFLLQDYNQYCIL